MDEQQVGEYQPVKNVQTETEKIALASLPYSEDSKKSKYLSYRLMNFTVREALTLAKAHFRSLTIWRNTDPEFAQIDKEGLTERRKKLAAEYLNVEFTRNFRMVLEQDFRVLYKALTLDEYSDPMTWEKIPASVMTDREHEYLLKLRSHYTPQHLAMIRQVLEGGSVNQPFDFTKLTLTLRRERETLEIRSE